MARLPVTEAALIERFGPHLNEAPPGGWDAGLEIDKVVETHCCFCGQQCGIKLKVHDNAVVGFEPWYDFPFNEGKLCPKGVKRYLQGSHPDRLLHPMMRDESSPTGFREVGWDEALSRVVSEIQRIQATYGDDAFAMLSGVSLTNEKSYLVGKFARLALHTANLDYNGRYCMVSAGVGNKKALGVDRAPNPWSDIPLADVVWIAGSNVAETFPITTSYIWRARDRGARLIVQDPRVVPLARTADLFLPVRPGTDSALFGAVLHELIRNDWLDHDFIDAHTVDFDAAAAAAADMSPAWAAEITGVPAARIEEAAEWWGTAATGMMLHARGIEQQSKGVDNVLAAINLGLATGKFGKPGCGVSTITGQGNGQGGREHGHKCDQLPGNRDITNPEHRAAVAKVWEVDEAEIPGKGIPALEIIEAIHEGKIKGLLSICFNPVVSSPDSNFTAEALDKLEFYSVIDFFLSESGQHADVVLAGSLHEEDEGTSTSGEGRIIKINAAVSPPGEARLDWKILLEIAERLGKGDHFRYDNTEEIFDELCRASTGGTADYTGATWARIEAEHGMFWPVPEVGHPGTPRLHEGGIFAHPDGKARFHAVAYRPPAEVVDDEYPVWLTTGRVVSQYLSGTQTRRIASLVDQYPEPLCEIHPTLAATLGIANGDQVTVRSRRGEITLPASVVATIRPDTVFIPYHWPGTQAANQLTIRAVDPLSKMPEFKVAAVRVERATAEERARLAERRATDAPT
ncbi:MAG: molybdopterin oxidoreductase family protein [Actinobacteria bacterium]|nr:molybdopterin oxidoreductase family protein [Actinomycetota bacterium]